MVEETAAEVAVNVSEIVVGLASRSVSSEGGVINAEWHHAEVVAGSELVVVALDECDRHTLSRRIVARRIVDHGTWRDGRRGPICAQTCETTEPPAPAASAALPEIAEVAGGEACLIAGDWTSIEVGIARNTPLRSSTPL